MNVLVPDGGFSAHKSICEAEAVSLNNAATSLHTVSVCNEELTEIQRYEGCVRDYFSRQNFKSACVAIGVFDGVHLGHQQVIKKMISEAKAHRAAPVVVTFDRHPKTVIPHSKPPLLIYSLKQKLKALADCGAQYVLLIPFDINFSRIEAACFVKILNYELGNIKSISVGRNFLFGHNRGGNVALLEEIGKKLGFTVFGLNPVSLDGRTISSTRVREAIVKGEIAIASQMLGRDYGVSGKVVPGDGIGKTLGFPTANIDVTGLVLPPRGVYAARVAIDENFYNAVLNIGLRPTLRQPDPQLRFELHILDFNDDIYGKEVETIFVKKLRDEIQFSSIEQLKSQIKKDIEQAREVLD